MRRVVITGIGIISSIGNNAAEVEASLRAGKSGIVFAPEYAEHGFRSQVHGMPQIKLEDHIDKRDLRFMGPGAAYNFLAMQQAIADYIKEPGNYNGITSFFEEKRNYFRTLLAESRFELLPCNG